MQQILISFYPRFHRIRVYFFASWSVSKTDNNNRQVFLQMVFVLDSLILYVKALETCVACQKMLRYCSTIRPSFSLITISKWRCQIMKINMKISRVKYVFSQRHLKCQIKHWISEKFDKSTTNLKFTDPVIEN